jgi:hypothetical protein
MPAKDSGPSAETLTEAQQRRAAQRIADHDRTLAAMHQLEAALGCRRPAPGTSMAPRGTPGAWHPGRGGPG